MQSLRREGAGVNRNMRSPDGQSGLSFSPLISATRGGCPYRFAGNAAAVTAARSTSIMLLSCAIRSGPRRVCAQCYDYHLTHSCARKPVQNERIPLPGASAVSPSKRAF